MQGKLSASGAATLLSDIRQSPSFCRCDNQLARVLPLAWWQPEAWRPSLLYVRLIFFSSQGPFLGKLWNDEGVQGFPAGGLLTLQGS